MARSYEFRRDMRNRKVKKRKRKIHEKMDNFFDTDLALSFHYGKKIHNALYEGMDGYFNKGYYGVIGNGRKTKTKNAYASHRHKGGYGKAILYSRHDKSQIEHMEIALKDYYNNKEETYFDSTN